MAAVWIVLAQFVCIQLISGAVVNVALRKPVQVSSRYDNRDPAIAVNGNTTAVDTCCVMHTAHGESTAWWWVDLQTQVQDATVKIYFRTLYTTRRNGVRLYTSPTRFSSYPSGELCHTVTGRASGTDISDVVTVNCTGRWRYLMVYTETDNDGYGAILDFGEVQVLVCDNNTYGGDCDKSCDSRQCAQNPTSCDRYTGACPAGECKAGWMGIDCTQVCLSGSYGSGCNLSCEDRNCRLSSTCNHVTGQCVGGCLSGWTGIDCKQACPSGSYGSGCNLSCGDRNCRNSSPCDLVTGQCVGGCLSGWNGTDCKQECTQGTNYGANCSKSCSARKCRTLPTTCDPETGQCPNECQDGWTGEDCTNACPNGMFGVYCKESCGHCNGSCDVVDGHCPNGCVDGYCGHHCNNKLESVSTRTNPVVAGVIGAVIAAVLMVVLCGGILLCLVRYGRLKWVKVPDHQKQSTEMGDITSAQVTRQTVSERSNSDPVHSNYAVLDVQTLSNNKDYDIIKNRVYENT